MNETDSISCAQFLTLLLAVGMTQRSSLIKIYPRVLFKIYPRLLLGHLRAIVRVKDGLFPWPLVAYTADEINEQFGKGSNAYFRIFSEGFWNGKNLWDVQKGTHVLWKSVPIGRNGVTSTKVEYFSGLVEEWHDSEFLDIS